MLSFQGHRHRHHCPGAHAHFRAGGPAQETAQEPVAQAAVQEFVPIDEDSDNSSEIEAADRPTTPGLSRSSAFPLKAERLCADLVVCGSGVKGLLAASKERASADEGLSSSREASAKSREPAEDETVEAVVAVVAERPSSRGGMAFDMTFEGVAARAVLPARLEKLSRATPDTDIDTLKRKLQAAEARRIIYENKLKDKMRQEAAKVEAIQAAQQEKTAESAVVKTQEKESKVLENRQAQLQQLRDKLRAKEMHAQKVREQKRIAQANGALAGPVVVVA